MRSAIRGRCRGTLALRATVGRHVLYQRIPVRRDGRLRELAPTSEPELDSAPNWYAMRRRPAPTGRGRLMLPTVRRVLSNSRCERSSSDPN